MNNSQITEYYDISQDIKKIDMIIRIALYTNEL